MQLASINHFRTIFKWKYILYIIYYLVFKYLAVAWMLKIINQPCSNINGSRNGASIIRHKLMMYAQDSQLITTARQHSVPLIHWRLVKFVSVFRCLPCLSKQILSFFKSIVSIVLIMKYLSIHSTKQVHYIYPGKKVYSVEDLS